MATACAEITESGRLGSDIPRDCRTFVNFRPSWVRSPGPASCSCLPVMSGCPPSSWALYQQGLSLGSAKAEDWQHRLTCRRSTAPQNDSPGCWVCTIWLGSSSFISMGCGCWFTPLSCQRGLNWLLHWWEHSFLPSRSLATLWCLRGDPQQGHAHSHQHLHLLSGVIC